MIQLKNLCAGYPGRPVLEDVSLDFRPGEVLAVLGPNGCGKSTLLRASNGLLARTGGEILVDGRPIEGLSAKEIARKIAYLPQSRTTPSITAGRMVLHGRFPYLSYPRRYGQKDYEMVYKALEWVGAGELTGRMLPELSGGQRQKVYLAMALAQDTAAILMDEPTTYLDIDRQLEVMRLCAAMRDAGKAVVLVLHDLPLAFRFADRLLLMRSGAPVFSGSPAKLARSGALEDVFHVRAHPVPFPDGTTHYLFLETQ